ncbi:MAG: hypothetical protein ABH873_06540 [Candidatus Firestonebacteria bacterium]
MINIENKAGSFSLDEKTGLIKSLMWKGKNIDLFKQLRQGIKGYIGGIRIFDELDRKWFSDYTTEFTVTNFKATKDKISFNKNFKGAKFNLKVTFTAEKDCIDWEVVMEKKNKNIEDRSIRVYFFLPLIAGWDVWAPAEQGEWTFDGMSSFEYMYGQIPYFGNTEIVVPIISHFNKDLNVGFSVIVPYDKKVPASKFQFQNGEKCFNWGNQEKPHIEDYPVFEVVNYYIGLVKNRKLQTNCKIFFHDGDWRCGLGATFEKYKEYFVPRSKNIYKREGVFQCGDIHTADHINKEKKVGLKYLELHGHFPWYGYYFPKEKRWRNVGILEGIYLKSEGKLSPEEVLKKYYEMTDKDLEVMKKEFPERRKWFYELSKKEIKKAILKLKKAGINVFYYINFSDGFKPFVEKRFESSIVKKENGEYSTCWRMCNLMNCDIGLPFGQYMLKTAKNILKEYPMLDGFFLDCWIHVNLDFAHDDGITVVNNKPCYSVNFSYDELNEKIYKDLIRTGRNNFANKPHTIRSMKSVDGVLLEGDGNVSEEKFFYSAIAKPIFLMWTSDAKTVDENLRRAVVLGGYPTTPYADYKSETKEGRKNLKELSKLYQKHLPLYAQFKERVLCFEPDPMRLSPGMRGKLYTVKDGYVAGIMNEGIEADDQIKYGKPKYAYFRIKRGYDLGVVEVMYPGDKKPKKVKFMFNGSIIAVPLINYKNCVVVKLRITKNTGKKISNIKFSEVIDSCGDPKTAFGQ